MRELEFQKQKSQIGVRAAELLEEQRMTICKRTDRLFIALMLIQWLAGIIFALMISPRTWIGDQYEIHVHVWFAIFLGGVISCLPIFMALYFPGTRATRHIIAVAQMLWSSMLIHLSGGRIETHFHVFGSLAFLTFYRDWRPMLSATAVVAVDHFFRGVWYPQSVFGVLVASPYRWIEHAAWVIFEDIFLIKSCLTGSREMSQISERQAELEYRNKNFEIEVRDRTQESIEAKQVAESANRGEE